MDIIQATRELGKTIQKDQRFIAFAKAKLAMENDEALQDKIGQFNIARMNLERLLEADEKENSEISEANDRLRKIYDDIMSEPVMMTYNETKSQTDKIFADVTGIIRMCFEGADPDTCELPEAGCTGSCSTCSGCH